MLLGLAGSGFRCSDTIPTMENQIENKMDS